MNRKILVITVDTEEDNSWDINSNFLETSNCSNIHYFQEICEENNFSPTYLLTYSMLLNKEFCDYLNVLFQNKKCFLGIHMHPWSTPPFVHNVDDNKTTRTIVSDYSYDELIIKFRTIAELFNKRFGFYPNVCRAGRWCTSSDYFSCLESINCLFDCSFTPHLNLSKTMGINARGNNYKNKKNRLTKISDNVLELPMSTFKLHELSGCGLKAKIKNLVFGRYCWIRPACFNLEDLIKFEKKLRNHDYIMFMIHSSELTPGLNPYVKTEKDKGKLLLTIKNFFSYLKSNNYYSKSCELTAEEIKRKASYGN